MIESECDSYPELTVIIPVYNEGESVKGILTKLIEVLKTSTIEYEVIAINDGSSDHTETVLRELEDECQNDHFTLISHPYNKGYGAALKTGIRNSNGRIIAMMDSDGQHDPQDLLMMLTYMHDYDVVIGSRTHTYQSSWHRGIANRFYNGLASWLADFKIMDLNSGYRLFKASVVKQYFRMFSDKFSFSTTSTLILLKAGYNLKFVPIHFQPRQAGTSKINVFKDGWRFILIILKIIVMYEPLRVFLPISAAAFIFSVLLSVYNIIYVYHTIRISNSSLLLFTFSVMVLLMGIVSEQIASIRILYRDRMD